MGSETNFSPASSSSAAASTSSTPSAKRSRDPEDEVYIDNLHSHKRYLSEIMASSLNGLSVGDNLTDSLVDSPRSESMCYIRDDISLQYSPMSEDLDDLPSYDVSMHVCSSQPESTPTSPVSPYRHQRTLSGLSSVPQTTSSPALTCNLTPVTSQARQRGSDSEGRFPSSPSDICHSADLRRAALLRSVRSVQQMKTQPHVPTPFDLSLSQGHDHEHGLETEDRPCLYMKSLIDESDYQIAECSSFRASESENRDKRSRLLNMHVKGDKSP
ncbi:PREDICTED: putative protein TPRXL [Ipomoea nil]|uniref:putative protein TPRXL n=1 Tax=Ipomoea nil TaxID=35883 RepID=UPI000901FF73|nr:PREDICTED: putative protein TPRXL [Ipomoea nil]